MRKNNSEGNETVTIEDVVVVKETKHGYSDTGALLCLIEGEEVWIPKSQISDDSEVYEEGTEGDLLIPRWLAEEKGLV